MVAFLQAEAGPMCGSEVLALKIISWDLEGFNFGLFVPSVGRVSVHLGSYQCCMQV